MGALASVISKELLDILVCPETHRPLQLADAPLIAQLNEAVAAGQLKNAAGETVESQLDGGLVRDDGQVLYPVLDGIPVLLVDQAIRLEKTD